MNGGTYPRCLKNKVPTNVSDVEESPYMCLLALNAVYAVMRGGKSLAEGLYNGKESLFGWHYMLIKTAAALPCKKNGYFHSRHFLLQGDYYFKSVLQKKTKCSRDFFFLFPTFYLWSLYLYLPQSGIGFGVCLSLKACDKFTFLLKF